MKMPLPRLLYRWLTPPTITGDEEEVRQVHMLHAILIGIIVQAFLVFLINLISRQAAPPRLGLDLLILLALVGLYGWLRAGGIRQVRLLLPVVSLISLTVLIIYEGSLSTPTVTGFLMIVILAGLLFDQAGILIATAACSLTLLGLLLAAQAGLLSRTSDRLLISQWVTITLFFILMAYLIYYARLNSKRSRQALKDEMGERERVELETRRLLEDLRTSEARYRALFEQTHDAVFILDLNGQHLEANQRAAEMLGYTVDEIKTLSVHDTSAEIDSSLNVISHLLAGEQVPLYERRFRKKNGQIFPVEINVELVRNKDGRPLHIQSVVRDISQRRRAEDALVSANEQLSQRVAEVERLRDELHKQAWNDPLTGLHNRRYLNEALRREIIRAQRGNEFLSVIISDIDHFKKINDTFGHDTGDHVLIEVANVLKGRTRGSDLVCRYGGEEFLLVFPGASASAAVQRAEQIRALLEAMVIDVHGELVQVTMSFGVATFPTHGCESEDLIRHADQALYLSKSAGRNCVTLWTARTGHLNEDSL